MNILLDTNGIFPRLAHIQDFISKIFRFGKKEEIIDRDRSCWMCGYYGWRSPKARARDGFSGRCHRFSDPKKPEFKLVSHRTEKETARKCERYFRRSEHMDLNEFLVWKSSMELDSQREVGKSQFRLITLIVAGVAIIDFACKLFNIFK